MNLTTVYPVGGRLVRDPVTRQRVPAEGLPVNLDESYWQRRLQDNDITTEAPQVAAAETADKRTSKKK